GRGAPRLGAVVAAAGEGYLDAGPLPPLASRRTYQLWADVNGSTVSLGLLGPDPEVTRFTVPEGTGRIEVTEEPVPGRLTPSSPVVTATLTSRA
ncbi:MAG: anti-sigma factor, partial [Acidimicrobiia bacterium]|nr:anti-sigma factor [Acidimicrobiia bacterium]